jgi:hypothetical protein
LHSNLKPWYGLEQIGNTRQTTLPDLFIRQEVSPGVTRHSLLEACPETVSGRHCSNGLQNLRHNIEPDVGGI